MPGEVVDGRDVDAVHDATRRAADRARRGEGPTLVEAKVERLLGHFLGDPQSYRTPEEIEALRRRDPLPAFVEDLRGRGLVDDAGLERLEREIEEKIGAAVAVARERPLASVTSARENVYAP
jgi:pyruvate dehydrogenase E1 component alpha subunit